LVGLGYRELSTAPTAVPLVRWLVQRLRASDAEHAAAEALEARSAEAALDVLERRLAEAVDLEVIEAGWLPVHRSSATLHRRRSWP
jgi:signal transduction protein with GAF and PtsI domain